MQPTNDLSILRDAVAASIDRSRVTPAVTLRPATVVRVSISQSLVDVRPDEIVGIDESFGGDDVLAGQTLGAQIIAPVGVRAGDRVMVMFVKPHGAYIVGRLAGDFEDWRFVGAPGSPAFAANWGNEGTTGTPGTNTYARVSFRRCGRWVELRGRASRNADVGGVLDIFQLPTDYRPLNNLSVGFNVTGPFGVNQAAIVVLRTGMVQVIPISGQIGGAGGFVSLDGITFSTDELGQVI